GDAGCINKPVNFAKRFFSFTENSFHFFFIKQIPFDPKESVNAFEFLKRRDIQVTADDIRIFFEECFNNCFSHSAASSGNDNGFIFKSHVIPTLFSRKILTTASPASSVLADPPISFVTLDLSDNSCSIALKM